MTGMRSGAGSPLVVTGADLYAALRPVIEQRDKDKKAAISGYEWGGAPGNGWFPSVSGSPLLGGNAWLATRSGIAIERITKIFRQATVSLAVADALLTAAGLEHKLQDGSVPVLPNPQMGPLKFAQKLAQAGVDDPSSVCDQLPVDPSLAKRCRGCSRPMTEETAGCTTCSQRWSYRRREAARMGRAA